MYLLVSQFSQRRLHAQWYEVFFYLTSISTVSRRFIDTNYSYLSHYVYDISRIYLTSASVSTGYLREKLSPSLPRRMSLSSVLYLPLYLHTLILFLLYCCIHPLADNDNTTERAVASVLVVEDLWCARSDAELYGTRVERLRSTWKKACLITSSSTVGISSKD